MVYPEIAADFDPRTVVIEPQDVLYKIAQLAGHPEVGLTAKLRENIGGFYELASVLAKMGAPVPVPRPSSISVDGSMRFVGKANAARPSQGTLLLTAAPTSSQQVTLNDGTGAREYSWEADGDVVVPQSLTIDAAARNLVNSINVDREAGNVDLWAAYLGQDLFGTTGALVVFLVGTDTPAEWDDNITITTDITGAVVTGFSLGVAP